MAANYQAAVNEMVGGLGHLLRASVAGAEGLTREQAGQMLKNAEHTSFPIYVSALCAYLSNDQIPETNYRQVAGILLRGTIDSHDESTLQAYSERWAALDAGIRANIKNALLSTLRSPQPNIRDAAAQIIGKIAQIEIPRNTWGELIPALLQNMLTAGVPAEVREATLKSLGYVCENIKSTVLANAADHILNAVVQGMLPTEADNNVKLAAVKTLTAALEFTAKNFQRDTEREYLMNIVIETTAAADRRVRRAAFECLVRVATLYYDYLKPHMQRIFNVAWKAIKEDEENVALQAIEFWSTVCDEEILVMQAEQEGITVNGQVRKNQNFIRSAVPALTPVLTAALLRGDPDPEGETWNISMAAGTCLNLIANTVRDDVVDHVIPFVQQNIGQANPRQREVALLAFGSILEGPIDKIRPMLPTVLPVLLRLLADTNAGVKDTAAWTLGRVAQFHAEGLPSESLVPFAQQLVGALGDDPRVSANACWALNNLAEAIELSEEEVTVNPFADHFVPIVSALLRAADREDADEANLRSSAYETINAVIKCIPDGLDDKMASLVTEFMTRVNNTFNSLDREEAANLQGLLCGVLQTLTRKLDVKIKFFMENLMQLYGRLFQHKGQGQDSSIASLHEEALLAIGALINAVGADFEPYLRDFMPVLIQGIQNRAEYHVCSVAVGTVGDIARALGPKILDWCPTIINELLADLTDQQLHRSVKPVIFSCFGDIALAISGAFDKWLASVMDMLKQACMLATSHRLDQTENWDLIDYMQTLRDSLLEAYSGIIQGLHADHKADLILPYVNDILQFLHLLTIDTCRKEEVARGAVGLLGDVINTVGPKLVPLHNQIRTFFVPLIQQCLEADNELTQDTAKWTQGVIDQTCK